ncbi:MAG: TRAP transporter substrate-binding protein [Deltaproteobacteria bacterium]|nr:TRAP transporter substrate-binding protein [Deltaproteobacteria bacterium]
MKKQKVYFFIGILLVFAFASMTYADTIQLRFAHQNPETAYSSINCSEPWFRSVEKSCNGKVQIKGYYGQSLAKGPNMWDAVKNNITDIGWCFHGYWPNLTPITDVISLPALPFTTAEKGSEVLWKLYEKFPGIQNEFKDVHVILFYSSHPYGLITTNKPVKTLEDLKGLKIRMTGGPPTDMVRTLGGIPMLIPMPDNYLSLQKGVIDGMGAPWEAIDGFRLYEVTKYHTETPFPAVYFSVSMNKAKWNSLPQDVKDAFTARGSLEGSKYWGHGFFDVMKPLTLEKIKKEGKEFNLFTLTSAERERWLEIGGKPIWENWVKQMEAKGCQNAREILDTTIALSK